MTDSSKSMVYSKFYKSVASTANFRFNAYRRLDFLDKTSNLALIFASTSLIITSIVIEIMKKKNLPSIDVINLGQLCIPIILLVLSILISSCRYGSRSEKIHECAQKINHIGKLCQYKIEEKKQINIFSHDEYIEYKNLCQQYADVISKYENHEDIDRISQKIKETLKGFFLLSSFRDLIAFLFNISLIGYFYLSLIFVSFYWVWYVLSNFI